MTLPSLLPASQRAGSLKWRDGVDSPHCAHLSHSQFLAHTRTGLPPAAPLLVAAPRAAVSSSSSPACERERHHVAPVSPQWSLPTGSRTASFRSPGAHLMTGPRQPLDQPNQRKKDERDTCDGQNDRQDLDSTNHSWYSCRRSVDRLHLLTSRGFSSPRSSSRR